MNLLDAVRKCQDGRCTACPSAKGRRGGGYLYYFGPRPHEFKRLGWSLHATQIHTISLSPALVKTLTELQSACSSKLILCVCVFGLSIYWCAVILRWPTEAGTIPKSPLYALFHTFLHDQKLLAAAECKLLLLQHVLFSDLFDVSWACDGIIRSAAGADSSWRVKAAGERRHSGCVTLCFLLGLSAHHKHLFRWQAEWWCCYASGYFNQNSHAFPSAFIPLVSFSVSF